MSTPVEELEPVSPNRRIGLWVTAILLQQTRPGGSMHSVQTISHRVNSNENEARGAAVKFAMDTFPGYNVAIVSTVFIELNSDQAIIATQT